MENLLQAIKHSIKNDNMYAALFIAISLPDICGKIQYPGIKSQKRYIDWFNQYLKDQYSDPQKPDSPFLTAEDMYAFRCSLIHEGSDEISTQSARIDINKFILISDGPHLNYFQNRIIKLQLSVKSFCIDICAAVERWLSNNDQNVNLIEYRENFIKIFPKGSIVDGIKFG
jgi:hypothetical protein